MKALFIGGTGTISTAITNLVAASGIDLTLLNRGNRAQNVPNGVSVIHADINDEGQVRRLLDGMHFDVVADFIGFVPSQVERDIRLFSGKTNQYIYISSASAYQKPMSHYRITESTPLANPYWQYSRDKIACENLLMAAYRESGFPVTIVRPSHTYGDTSVPVAVHGSKGSWQVLDRIRRGKPVIVHGDGLSLWTFTHNTDFAKAFFGLMNNPHAIGEAVHITSDESVTWNAAYETIAGILGAAIKKVHIASDFLASCDPKFEGELLGDKANSVVFDNSKIKRLVPGFTANVRFDQGVRRTIEYVMSHEECRIPDPEFDAWCDRVISVYTSIKL
jgi:nucleoside-diphosphate-sugar epimerase